MSVKASRIDDRSAPADGRGRLEELWRDAAERAIAYRDGILDRRVPPLPEALTELVQHLGGDLPEHSTDAARVIEMLDRYGSLGAYARKRKLPFVDLLPPQGMLKSP